MKDSHPAKVDRPTWLRTDKVSGTITCAFGVVMICFASLGLMGVATQRVMISAMQPLPPLPNGQSFIDVMNAMHGVWFVYFPMMIGGGIVYAVSGFYIRRGSLVVRRIAQANAIVGYLWIVGYSISCHQVFDAIGHLTIIDPPADFIGPTLDGPAFTAYGWLVTIVNALMFSAFPTGILYLLSRPRSQAAGMPEVVR